MDELRKLVRRAVAKYPDDIGKATDWALRWARKLTDWKGLVDGLIKSAIRGMVCDERHQVTTKAKLAAGLYGGPAKVSGASETVDKITINVYFGDQYFIGARTLSVILGEELADVAANELAIGNGHLVNARFCERLQQIVPEGKTVKEAVTDKRLRSLFREVNRKGPGLAEAGH